MEIAILTAKILGIIYLSFGVGLLFNKDYYAKAIEDLLKNTGFMISGGFLAIVMGLCIIEYHNIWVKNWTVIITIIGWIALLKGILLLAFPKFASFFSPMLKSKKLYMILIPSVILFGLVLIYFGFFS
tara:strand:- start:18095 stop:18478 length:384 start_codon:yes stop_codon:yes gene_type:complete